MVLGRHNGGGLGRLATTTIPTSAFSALTETGPATTPASVMACASALISKIC